MSPSSPPAPGPPRAPCRVLIADDHELVRTAIRCLLQTSPAITVVAEARDGNEALAMIKELRPDVALVDIGMPKRNGIEVAREVTTASVPTRILALTAHEDDRCVRDTFAAGAAGYLPKSAAATELFAAIHAVAAGRRYLHPRLVQALIGTISHGGRPYIELSGRESDVLRLLALGYSNKEIAVTLSVSVKTVETYKARAMEKIGANSRVGIVQFAVKHGWLANPGEPATP